MKTVWKWTLTPVITFDMPVGAEILAVQTCYNEPQLWALVDPSVPQTVKRSFRSYGTGSDMPDEPGTHIGTFQIQADGQILVFHVFETT